MEISLIGFKGSQAGVVDIKTLPIISRLKIEMRFKVKILINGYFGHMMYERDDIEQGEYESSLEDVADKTSTMNFTNQRREP